MVTLTYVVVNCCQRQLSVSGQLPHSKTAHNLMFALLGRLFYGLTNLKNLVGNCFSKSPLLIRVGALFDESRKTKATNHKD